MKLQKYHKPIYFLAVIIAILSTFIVAPIALLKLADISGRAGKNHAALVLYKIGTSGHMLTISCIPALDSCGSPAEGGLNYYLATARHYEQTNPELAKALYEEGLEFIERHRDVKEKTVGQLLATYAFFEQKNGKFAEANSLLEKAEPVFKQAIVSETDTEEKGRIILMLASVYDTQKRYEEAYSMDTQPETLNLSWAKHAKKTPPGTTLFNARLIRRILTVIPEQQALQEFKWAKNFLPSRGRIPGSFGREFVIIDFDDLEKLKRMLRNSELKELVPELSDVKQANQKKSIKQ